MNFNIEKSHNQMISNFGYSKYENDLNSMIERPLTSQPLSQQGNIFNCTYDFVHG